MNRATTIRLPDRKLLHKLDIEVKGLLPQNWISLFMEPKIKGIVDPAMHEMAVRIFTEIGTVDYPFKISFENPISEAPQN